MNPLPFYAQLKLGFEDYAKVFYIKPLFPSPLDHLEQSTVLFIPGA